MALLVAVSMPVLYLLQERLADGGLALAFRPASLWDGGWWPGILTSMFVHDGWAHVGMNALGALAFGPPVARLLGGRAGAAAFLLFYVACGLLATVGYGFVHPDSQGALVGASGAVFGLLGGALRLLDGTGRVLLPLSDRRFLATSAAIMGVNAAVGLLGLSPGMEGAQIAWEAHAFGFVGGALLMGPLTRLIGVRREPFASPADLGDPDR